MVGSLCVGLVVTCTFNVFLTGYNATVLDRSVAHVGVGMSNSRGCSDQYIPSVIVCNEAMMDASKTIWL